MSIASKSDPILILDDASADGFGSAVKVKGYNSVIIMLSTTDSADGVLKVAGSCEGTQDDMSPDVVDFDSPGTRTNHWTYIGSYDWEDSSFAAGKTGWTLTGTDSDNLRTIRVNVDELNWLNLEVSGRSAGKVTARMVGFVLS